MQTIRKENFLDVLSQAIPDENPSKAMILQAANQLIPSSNSPVPGIRRTYRLYQRFHPERAGEEPELEDVLSWLRQRGAVEYASQLEGRLARLSSHLDSLGVIRADEDVPVPADTILAMRMIASGPTLIEEEEDPEE